MDNDAEDYEVGYKKPPKKSRFAKGQSGNPKGRPKGSLGLAARFVKHSKEKITVNEGGRQTQLPILDVIIRSAFHNAAKGDATARRDVLQLCKSAEETPVSEWTSPEKQKVEARAFAIFVEQYVRGRRKCADKPLHNVEPEEDTRCNIIP